MTQVAALCVRVANPIFVGSSVSVGSASIVMPAGIQAGDFAVMFDTAINVATALPTAVTPAGWTSGTNGASGATHGTRAASNYKMLTGTETVVTGMVGTLDTIKIMMVFRPLAGTTPNVQNFHGIINGAGTGVGVNAFTAHPAVTYLGIGMSTTLLAGTFTNPQIGTGDTLQVNAASTFLKAEASYAFVPYPSAAGTFSGDPTFGVSVISLQSVWT